MITWISNETWDCDDDRLPPSSGILRSAPDKGFIDTMAKGQINPIIIRIDETDHCYLEAGRKRLLAVRQLKADGRTDGHIDVRTFNASESDGLWITLVENAQSSANPVSDYQAVKRMLFKGNNYADIAKQIGMPVNYVKKLDSDFAQVPDWALEAILAEKMVPSVAKELGKLSPKLQDECRVEMKATKNGKLTMDMVKEHHRLVQNQATAQTMSFSGPADNLRRVFSRAEIEKIYDILIGNDPDQAVILSRSYIESILAQEAIMEEATKELMDRIYDTLMENVGLSEYHTKFPVDKICGQFVDSSKGEMYFQIGKKGYELKIKEIPYHPEIEDPDCKED